MGRAAPRLSICIPTHHGRAATLEEAIDSVRAQVSTDQADLIEICVSDNASADGTAELVSGLGERSPIEIRYRRNDTDVGPARNTLQVVEMARGDYCWILSSDDLLVAGAVQRVLDLLDEHDGIVALTVDQVVFNAVDGSRRPRGLYDNRPASGELSVLTGTQLIVEELGLLFSGISLHVFDRRRWLRFAREDRDEILGGHGLFAHAVILARLARESPRWLWCPEPLVRYRAGVGGVGPIVVTSFVARFVDDLARVLRSQLDEAGYRRAMYRYARGLCHPAAILAFRRQPNVGLRHDLLLATVVIRRLRWIDGFWSETLPALLIPRFASRFPSMALRTAQISMRAYRRLVGSGPLKARLAAATPAQVFADTIAGFSITIENHGLPLRTWWPWLPLYVSCRWRQNGFDVDGVATSQVRINHVVWRGQHRKMSLRTSVPAEPGRYELGISLTWDGVWLEELTWSEVVEVRQPPT